MLQLMPMQRAFVLVDPISVTILLKLRGLLHWHCMCYDEVFKALRVVIGGLMMA